MNEHDSADQPADRQSEPLKQSHLIDARLQRIEENASTQPSSDQAAPAKSFLRSLISAEWWQVGINGLLAAIGIYALFIYNGQLDEMRKSTEAATKAANAADLGAKKSEAGSHLEQRAWVAAAINKDTVIEAGKPFTGTIGVRNTGRTFAKDVRVFARSDGFSKNSPKPDFDAIDDRGLAQETRGTLLSPEMDLPVYIGNKETGEKLTQDVIDLMKSGDLPFYVHGKLRYTDVFGCDHWTTFCTKLITGTLTFGSCEDHNDTDNNCL